MSFNMPEYMAPDFTKECFLNAPDCSMEACARDKAAPKAYHATSIYPEYFKVGGEWYLATDSRMDAVPVWDPAAKLIRVVEFRNLKKGDLVITGRTEDGSEGIYVHADCWKQEKEGAENIFAFRQGRTRETSFTRDYRELTELLKYEKENGGYVVWVLGPACSFDCEARRIMGELVRNGYCQALLAGNALATHDLEGAFLGTALGCDIENQQLHYMGHYNHLDLLNTVNSYGSIPAFIEGEHIDNGIIYNCVKSGVPFVLTSSIRDDGPLPEVIHDAYDGQNTIRSHVRRATTVIGMATMLHTIATGNMTPTYRVLDSCEGAASQGGAGSAEKAGDIRPVYFYMVDASEFVANKLADRGSLSAKGIVTNVQDFMRNLAAGLGL